MPRLTLRDPERMPAEDRAIYDRVAQARPPRADGRLVGPFDGWMLNPKLFDAVASLGGVLLNEVSLERRHVELAILVTAKIYEAQYEWYAHAKHAAEAGLSAEVIAAIKEGAPPPFADEAEKTVYAVASELHETKTLTHETYARAAAQLGETGLVELVNVIGCYVMVSMHLNAFDGALPDGAKPPFA